jgi:tetratricopeptide (TPR) repeat protein
VAWSCPDGHGQSLDVCPIGPLIPARQLCLNCGNPYLSDEIDARCGACGLSKAACPAALGVADAPADSIAAARAAFAQGLFRRGTAILNYAILEDAGLLEAWFLKTRFLNSVGFNRLAAEMLDGALPRFASIPDRIWLLEEQAFLWAECERGEEALRSADAAAGLGSISLRTHYLRGRALGLLGRLQEAREEMTHVLALDPGNADARRGLDMIDKALRPEPKKGWWPFWKS